MVVMVVVECGGGGCNVSLASRKIVRGLAATGWCTWNSDVEAAFLSRNVDCARSFSCLDMPSV
jgi:hypothetical protein